MLKVAAATCPADENCEKCLRAISVCRNLSGFPLVFSPIFLSFLQSPLILFLFSSLSFPSLPFPSLPFTFLPFSSLPFPFLSFLFLAMQCISYVSSLLLEGALSHQRGVSLCHCLWRVNFVNPNKKKKKKKKNQPVLTSILYFLYIFCPGSNIFESFWWTLHTKTKKSSSSFDRTGQHCICFPVKKKKKERERKKTDNART